MKKVVLVLLCVVLAGTCTSAFAATAPNCGLQGRSELSVAAAWLKVSADDVDVNATLLAFDYGKYLTNNWEVRLDTIWAHGHALGDNADALLLGPAVEYNFVPDKPSSTIPYVGVGALYADASAVGLSDSSTKAQYFAGVKIFLNGDYNTSDKNVFIEYRHFNADLFDADITVDTVWGGISVLF